MTKREQCVEWLDEHNLFPAGTQITCDECDQSDTCKWAYDPYNLNGDCLGDK